MSRKNVLTLLEADHNRIKALLEALHEHPPLSARRQLEQLEFLSKELRLHTRVEEDLIYPALRSRFADPEDDAAYFESLESHRVQAHLLAEAVSCDPLDPLFRARIKVLKDLVGLHIDEEEGELFPQFEVRFTERELNHLAEEAIEHREAVEHAGFGRAQSTTGLAH